MKERFEDYEKDEENLEIATEALSDLEERGGVLDDRLWRDPSKVRSIAKGISDQFINKGYVDFKGRRVTSPEDVALMMQVCRDPRFETFRILLVRNNKVVDVTNITSQLPVTSAAIEKDSWAETTQTMKARMKALKADGYYLIHNHPSGNVSASPEDLSVTAGYIQNIPGFLGHVILDHDKFGLLQHTDQGISTSEESLDAQTIDFMHMPEIDHPLLGQHLDGKTVVAQAMKSLQTSNATTVAIYVDSKLCVRAIQEIDSALMKDPAKDVLRHLLDVEREMGARGAFLGTADTTLYENIKHFCRVDFVIDVLDLSTGQECSRRRH